MIRGVTFQRAFLGGMLCAAGIVAAAAAAPAQSPMVMPLPAPSRTAVPATPLPLDTPAAPAPPAGLTARARAALDGVRSGNLDRRQLDAAVSGLINDDVLHQMQALLQGLGDVSSFTFVRTMAPAGTPVYAYRISGTSGQPDEFELISFDASGKISRLSFVAELS